MHDGSRISPRRRAQLSRQRDVGERVADPLVEGQRSAVGRSGAQSYMGQSALPRPDLDLATNDRAMPASRTARRRPARPPTRRSDHTSGRPRRPRRSPTTLSPRHATQLARSSAPVPARESESQPSTAFHTSSGGRDGSTPISETRCQTTYRVVVVRFDGSDHESRPRGCHAIGFLKMAPNPCGARARHPECRPCASRPGRRLRGWLPWRRSSLCRSAAPASPRVDRAPARIWGVTLDDVTHARTLATSLRRLPERTMARVVFDPGMPPASYAGSAATAPPGGRRAGSARGLVRDHVVLRGARTGPGSRRTWRRFPHAVDVWEIGNEVNGEWTGRPADVVAKTLAGYRVGDCSRKADRADPLLQPRLRRRRRAPHVPLGPHAAARGRCGTVPPTC